MLDPMEWEDARRTTTGAASLAIGRDLPWMALPDLSKVEDAALLDAAAQPGSGTSDATRIVTVRTLSLSVGREPADSPQRSLRLDRGAPTRW